MTVDEPEGLPEGYAKLEEISATLRKQEAVEPVTVRELLSWFGAQRRGWQICLMINEALAEAKLRTEPYFQYEYIDAPIEFQLEDSSLQTEPPPDTVEVHPEVGQEEVPRGSPQISNPTYRIGKLKSANSPPVCVSPNDSIVQAVTIMLANDFSQLPVIVGERDVKGVVSWSSIGRSLALGAQCTEVRECMDPARVIGSDVSLFSAITEIVNSPVCVS
jgi:CBS domain-containing protein